MTTDPYHHSLSPAVNRAAAILDMLAKDETGRGITDIARRLNRPKSSIANILGALVKTGLVERDDRRLSLGGRLVELAGAYLSQIDQVGSTTC